MWSPSKGADPHARCAARPNHARREKGRIRQSCLRLSGALEPPRATALVIAATSRACPAPYGTDRRGARSKLTVEISCHGMADRINGGAMPCRPRLTTSLPQSDCPANAIGIIAAFGVGRRWSLGEITGPIAAITTAEHRDRFGQTLFGTLLGQTLVCLGMSRPMSRRWPSSTATSGTISPAYGGSGRESCRSGRSSSPRSRHPRLLACPDRRPPRLARDATPPPNHHRGGPHPGPVRLYPYGAEDRGAYDRPEAPTAAVAWLRPPIARSFICWRSVRQRRSSARQCCRAEGRRLETT